MRSGALLPLVLVLACRPAASPTTAPPGNPANVATNADAPPSGTKDPAALLQVDATFLLHKWERRIGEENLRVHPGELRSSFVFSDRGSRVPLAASLTLGPDGLPRRFQMWGKTSRLSEADIDVTVVDGQATVREGDETRTVATPPLYFTAAGYAPMAVKEALILAWHHHGRPAAIPLLPTGTVTIERRGADTLDGADGKPITLERLSLGGLKWGRETAWIDDQQRLIAVVTNDAEFSHFEVVRRGHEGLLTRLVAIAASEGTADLAKIAAPPLREGRWAIVGARLVDGTDAPPIDDAVVVIDGGKIVSAGKTPPPAGIPVLEARGKTLLPGLWDMHAHYEQVEWGPIYLAAGVTTVRDAGNSLAFLTGLRGSKLAPRILCAGFLDGKDGNAFGKLEVGVTADIAPAVARIKAAGCTQIKIYSSVDPLLVAPLAKEAHRQGLDVSGHVPDGMLASEAVAAGFDLISHISFITGGLLPKGPPPATNKLRLERLLALDVDGPAARKLYRGFVAGKVAIDPTMALYELISDGPKHEPGLARVIPELRAILAGFGPGPGTPPDEAALAAKLTDKWLATIGAMHRAGVIIVAGTDQAVPGHSLHRELELYVRAGMTPLAAIQSATSVPARVMKLDGELGTIAAGKRADLVLVDGDPLAQISDIRKISVVVTDGRAYETAALWPVAGFSP